MGVARNCVNNHKKAFVHQITQNYFGTLVPQKTGYCVSAHLVIVLKRARSPTEFILEFVLNYGDVSVFGAETVAVCVVSLYV